MALRQTRGWVRPIEGHAVGIRRDREQRCCRGCAVGRRVQRKEFGVPANRSRTERWRESLDQIRSRGGGIEIAPVGPDAGLGDAVDLVCRVRVVDFRDGVIAVEPPAVAGTPVQLQAGDTVVGVITVGQNRWMFRSRVESVAGRGHASVVRLAEPDQVERCRRADPYRVSTASLSLPAVECWPLLDPTTVVAAEMASRSLVRDSIARGTRATDEPDAALVLPEVGPKFEARLMNIGGGGFGLVVEPEHASALQNARLVWTRLWLAPQIPEPVGLTARIAHSHMDSTQQRYAGCAFEFTFNPSHKQFVVETVTRFLSSRLGRAPRFNNAA